MIWLIVASSYFVIFGKCQFEYGQEYKNLDPYEYEYEDLDPYKYESGKEEKGIDGRMAGSGFNPKLTEGCGRGNRQGGCMSRSGHYEVNPGGQVQGGGGGGDKKMPRIYYSAEKFPFELPF